MDCSNLNEVFNIDGPDWIEDEGCVEQTDWEEWSKERRRVARKKWLEKDPDYHKKYNEKNKERISKMQKLAYAKRKEERGAYWFENISKEEYNKKTRERYHRKRRKNVAI